LKKKISKFLLISLLVFLFPKDVFAANIGTITIGKDTFYTRNISLHVNNKKIENLPIEPVLYEDRVLVPSREIFEPLGAYVVYNDDERTVYIIYNSNIIAIPAGSDVVKINEVPLKMTVPSKIVNDKLLVPLRSVSEIFGLDVEWYDESSVVTVNEKGIPNSNVSIPPEPSAPSIPWNEPNIDNSIPTNEEPFDDSALETSIINVDIPSIDNKQNFIIELNKKPDNFLYSSLNDNRIVFDFIGAKSSLPSANSSFSNPVVSEIRSGVETLANGTSKSRLVFSANNKNFSAVLSEDKKSALISFNSGNPKNEIITQNNNFSFINGVLKLSKQGKNFSADNLNVYDNYDDLKYTIVLPAGLDYGLKNATVNTNSNDFVSSIDFNVVNNKIHITLNEKQIAATIISEDSDYFYIKVVNPKEKYDKIILLDPGHGGKHPGAVNDLILPGTTIMEKDIVLEISQNVKNKLENEGKLKVYMTRNSDSFVDLVKRAEISNSIADVFVSIHINAALNTTAHGIETIYFEKIIQNSKGISSREVAEIFQRNLIKETGARNRGVKTDALVVLKENNNPSVLLELNFLSNPAEVVLLMDESYKEKLAVAITNGINEVFGNYTPQR